MEMTPLHSSNIRAVGYDPETHIFIVEFHNGGRYSAQDVPQRLYEGLVAAESPGGYFARMLRNAYTFAREN